MPLDRMQTETLQRSVHHGFYVCDDCFDGPDDLDAQPRPDVIENTPDNWWS